MFITRLKILSGFESIYNLKKQMYTMNEVTEALMMSRFRDEFRCEMGQSINTQNCLLRFPRLRLLVFVAVSDDALDV